MQSLVPSPLFPSTVIDSEVIPTKTVGCCISYVSEIHQYKPKENDLIAMCNFLFFAITCLRDQTGGRGMRAGKSGLGRGEGSIYLNYEIYSPAFPAL